MRAMILAAGEGMRLRPLTSDLPKAMLPIGDKPLLEHTLNWLRAHEITEVAINLHYKPETVIDYFGNGERFGVEIVYSIENLILGTAGALSKLRHYFTDTFLTLYGDLLTNLNISSLVAFHKLKQSLATITLHEVENPSASGIVALDDVGRIRRFVEKPSPQEVFADLANAGIFVLEAGIIDYIPVNTFYDFAYDLFPSLIRDGTAIYGYPITDYLIDIGTAESYHRAEADWQQGRVKRMSKKFKLE